MVWSEMIAPPANGWIPVGRNQRHHAPTRGTNFGIRFAQYTYDITKHILVCTGHMIGLYVEGNLFLFQEKYILVYIDLRRAYSKGKSF